MTDAAGTQLRADPAIEAPAPWRTLRGPFAAGGSLALDRWLLPLSLVGRDPGAHCELLDSATLVRPAAQHRTAAHHRPAGRDPPAAGDTLISDAGSWKGAPTALTYQWLRCGRDALCSPIAGATANRYAVGVGDAGRILRVTVSAHNARGVASATSAATPTVSLGMPLARIGMGFYGACGIAVAGGVVCWAVEDTRGDGTQARRRLGDLRVPGRPLGCDGDRRRALAHVRPAQRRERRMLGHNRLGRRASATAA